MSSSQTTSHAHGLRVFTCGHSFHVWVKDILIDVAQAAGIKDHNAVGLSSIGGSRVIQHWDVPDETNVAKKALRAGAVDVLTLSPIWLPDEGLEKFAALAFAHNPQVRVTVQEYWLPNDEYNPIYPLDVGKQVDHDAAAMPALRQCHAAYFRDMDEEVRRINRRLGKEVVFIVPAGQAVLELREKILAGSAPGLTSQSELFTDSWGHPAAPIQALAAYCHFAVIYRRNPLELPVPAILAGHSRWGDPMLARLLQQLAWDAVTKHPQSGLR